MEKSTKDYDLEEAKIKDEILRYCQAQNSRALIDSVWEYCQPILHRKTTTKEEALRAFIWTTLCINEIVTLMDSDDSIKD